MKKIYFTISVFLLAFTSFGQIVLNQNNCIPPLGTSYDFLSSTTYNPNYTPTGAGQTWDFSGFTGTKVTSAYHNATSGVDAVNHVGATMVEKVSGYENYWNISASSYSFEGAFIPGAARINFSDPKEYLFFPMAFNQTKNETFSGKVNNIRAGQIFDRSGTITIKADGSGVLKFPGGKTSNVLKVTNVASYTDKFGGSTIYTYTDSLVFWYDGITKNYLAAYVATYANGVKSLGAFYLIDQSVLGNGESFKSSSNINVYPNPASQHVSVSGLRDVERVELLSMSGQVLESYDVFNEASVHFSVSDYQAGLYLIKIYGENGVSTKRLLVN
ncbi:MAG: hypothetical protein CL840_20860 [Crocinitomicaceae bacterium]|mgnify:CR=1 FL=1|nr:hypothetical protein [Crocinitomicaceae bacterium]|tara:strand:- start:15441 stop:16427 length:987 start_codon:yes stop_codon:yes gene_type:complete